jgi:signal transduction histidine kinase
MNALTSSAQSLSVCHAGLWNAAVPISVAGKPRAVVLFGEMLLEDTAAHNESLLRHEALVASLGLTSEQALELRNRLTASKRYTAERIDKLRERVKQFERWLYELFAQEDRIRHGVENVSHEVFTRLQAVVAEAENLTTGAAGISTTEITAQTEKILNAALALNTVVETLGSFLEEYRFRNESVGEVLEEAKRTYEPEAVRRGIEVHVDLPDQPIYAEISKTHLQMALNNLVQNAIKYSFKTVPTRRTRTVDIRCLLDGPEVIVTIVNYGVGILPDEVDRIFELGFKGHLTQGEYRHGSGRGLYMVKQVIDRHSGRIAVESKQMSPDPLPEGQPHLNRFRIVLPKRQKRS